MTEPVLPPCWRSLVFRRGRNAELFLNKPLQVVLYLGRLSLSTLHLKAVLPGFFFLLLFQIDAQSATHTRKSFYQMLPFQLQILWVILSILPCFTTKAAKTGDLSAVRQPSIAVPVAFVFSLLASCSSCRHFGQLSSHWACRAASQSLTLPIFNTSLRLFQTVIWFIYFIYIYLHLFAVCSLFSPVPSVLVLQSFLPAPFP